MASNSASGSGTGPPSALARAPTTPTRYITIDFPLPSLYFIPSHITHLPVSLARRNSSLQVPRTPTNPLSRVTSFASSQFASEPEHVRKLAKQYREARRGVNRLTAQVTLALEEHNRATEAQFAILYRFLAHSDKKDGPPFRGNDLTVQAVRELQRVDHAVHVLMGLIQQAEGDMCEVFVMEGRLPSVVIAGKPKKYSQAEMERYVWTCKMEANRVMEAMRALDKLIDNMFVGYQPLLNVRTAA